MLGWPYDQKQFSEIHPGPFLELLAKSPFLIGLLKREDVSSVLMVRFLPYGKSPFEWSQQNEPRNGGRVSHYDKTPSPARLKASLSLDLNKCFCFCQFVLGFFCLSQKEFWLIEKVFCEDWSVITRIWGNSGGISLGLSRSRPHNLCASSLGDGE